MRIAIAHDYLTQRGGAEKVVLAMARAFPEAPIHTTLFEPESTFPEFSDLDVRVSPINRVGALRRNHRAALPVLPLVASAMHVDADVVLASSSGWAHGFRTSGRTLVYCYSPARWLYQTDRYLGDSGSRLARGVLSVLGPSFRAWDRRAAARADEYLAISSAVRDRIRSVYGRDSEVVPAPHSIDSGASQEPVAGLEDASDFWLCVSRLLPYKNVDRVVEAFGLSPDRRLVVVGTGPEESRLRASLPSNVTLVGNLSDAQIRWLYARSRALVAASYEDFGLTPIEAATFGKPSAVLRWGGFLDTVAEGRSGLFFDQPDPAAIARTVDAVESTVWDATAVAEQAARFSEERFSRELRRRVAALAEEPAHA